MSTDNQISDQEGLYHLTFQVVEWIDVFTSKRIIKTIQIRSESRREWMLNRFSYKAWQHSPNKTYQVWTHENHGVYLYTSARFYAGLDCVLPAGDIGLPWKTV